MITMVYFDVNNTMVTIKKIKVLLNIMDMIYGYQNTCLGILVYMSDMCWLLYTTYKDMLEPYHFCWFIPLIMELLDVYAPCCDSEQTWTTPYPYLPPSYPYK